MKEARFHRTREQKISQILTQIFSHLCCLWIIIVIALSTQDGNMFLQVNHLRKCFLEQGRSANAFDKV